MGRNFLRIGEFEKRENDFFFHEKFQVGHVERKSDVLRPPERKNLDMSIWERHFFLSFPLSNQNFFFQEMTEDNTLCPILVFFIQFLINIHF